MSETRRVALVTGASSGIGAAFARELARRGWDLILVARRANRLEELARELEAARGVRVEVLPADLTVDADLAKVAERIARAGNLELLVNNAGFGSRGNFFEAELEGQERMHRLHVLAAMRLTHAALAGMVARGRGGLINVSSVAAFGSTPGSVSYSATKAWMNSFTEALALELRAAGSPVRVQALCPGFTRTEFQEAAKIDRNIIPRGWWMSAEEVVAASLGGLERGRLIVVPGLRYKLMVLMLRLIPRSLRHTMVMIYARRTKRT
jgi:short-subunit dehydrogenase